MSFLGGLWDSFSGKSARQDLDKGINAVGQGRDQAVGAWQKYGDDAQRYMQPWLNRGGREYYDATLGINPNLSANDADKAYFSNNADQEQLRLQQKERGWLSNSRGYAGTAQDSMAAARVNAQNYGNWQNRLAGVAGAEQGAAGTAGGYAMGTGAGIAGAHMGATGQIADLYGQRARSENTLAQNVIGGAAAAGSFFGGRGPSGGSWGNNLGRSYIPPFG